MRTKNHSRNGRPIVQRGIGSIAAGRSGMCSLALVLALGGLLLPRMALADTTGEQAPTVTTGGFTDGANAFVCDDVNVAVPTAHNQAQSYSTYGLSLPGNAIITGIRVRVRANDGNKNNRKINVSLSWDGGATFTAPLATRNFRRNTPIRDYSVGGSAVLWGRTWTVSELSDASFQVRAVARMPGGVGADVIHLDCIPVTVFYRMPGAPNLAVDKIDSPDPVQPEAELTYTLSYGNTGESTATNTLIADAVPANTTFVSATPTPVTAPPVGGTGTVIWNLGSVALGDTGAVSMVVKVEPNLANGTLLSNDNYSISSDQNAATIGNAVTTTVQGTIALSLSKTDSPDPVAPGGTLTYVLMLSNGGNAPSTNLVVNDAYDGNVMYQSYTSTCPGISGGPDQWAIPSLSANASCTITITTTVAAPLVDGILLVNVADVSDDAASAAEATAITAVRNPALCGDSVVTTPEEECDEGGANGTTGSCCTATCTIRAVGQTCRHVTGDCDVAEACDGAAATCPSDSLAIAGTPCGDPSTSACDNSDSCNDSGLCLANHEPMTTICRPDAGECDVADTCDGGGNCSADVFEPAGIACGSPSDTVCDDPDSCDGAGSCAPNPEPETTVCRPDAGDCDVEESCDGAGACPSDALEPGGTSCDDGLFCTVSDQCESGVCDGAAMDCSESDTECRTGTCNEDTNECEGPPKPDGTTCDDDDACTVPDTCTDGDCLGVPDSLACLDHFGCYKAKAAPGALKFPGVAAVSLIDTFGSATAAVTKPKWLCTPASRDGVPASAPSHPDHLESYRLKPATHFGGATASLRDGYGDTAVKLRKASLLLVPTAKSLEATPAAPTNPTVDHFQCYKAKVLSATASLPVSNVMLGDQFGSQTAEVLKVKQVCAPVDKDGEEPGAGSHTGYLVCYLQRSLPRFVKQSPVYTTNSFGSEQLAVVKPTILCMPALRLP